MYISISRDTALYGHLTAIAHIYIYIYISRDYIHIPETHVVTFGIYYVQMILIYMNRHALLTRYMVYGLAWFHRSKRRETYPRDTSDTSWQNTSTWAPRRPSYIYGEAMRHLIFVIRSNYFNPWPKTATHTPSFRSWWPHIVVDASTIPGIGAVGYVPLMQRVCYIVYTDICWANVRGLESWHRQTPGMMQLYWLTKSPKLYIYTTLDRCVSSQKYHPRIHSSLVRETCVEPFCNTANLSSRN